jgi:ribosomal protein S18 acetylase RimI-like enzyme
LHVQTSNDAALEFYKKFGFTVTDTIKDYYKRIDPPDCFVLSKPVVPGGSGAGAPVTEASA